MSKHKNRHLNESTGLLDANDEDGFLARSQLYFMARDAIRLHGMIGDRDELPPWLSAKITKAAESIEAAREYIEYHTAIGGEPEVEPGVPADVEGEFHNELDDLVHDTFGPSPDEVNETPGMNAIAGPELKRIAGPAPKKRHAVQRLDHLSAPRRPAKNGPVSRAGLGIGPMAMESKDDPCWKNYKMVGMKKKNGKEVPNCVPKESVEEGMDFNDNERQKAASLMKIAKAKAAKQVKGK